MTDKITDLLTRLDSTETGIAEDSATVIRDLVRQRDELRADVKNLKGLAEEAFRDGFRSPETYNDVLLNDEDGAWENSYVHVAIANVKGDT